MISTAAAKTRVLPMGIEDYDDAKDALEAPAVPRIRLGRDLDGSPRPIVQGEEGLSGEPSVGGTPRAQETLTLREKIAKTLDDPDFSPLAKVRRPWSRGGGHLSRPLPACSTRVLLSPGGPPTPPRPPCLRRASRSS